MEIQLVLIAVVAMLALTGCAPKGPAQETGERIDEIVDNAKEGDPLFKKKGPMEKMGDAIDNTFGH